MRKRVNTRVDSYRKTFDNVHGKRVLHDLFKSHGMMTSTFNGNPQETAYLEGQRSVVLAILKILKTKPVDVENLINRSMET